MDEELVEVRLRTDAQGVFRLPSVCFACGHHDDELFWEPYRLNYRMDKGLSALGMLSALVGIGFAFYRYYPATVPLCGADRAMYKRWSFRHFVKGLMLYFFSIGGFLFVLWIGFPRWDAYLTLGIATTILFGSIWALGRHLRRRFEESIFHVWIDEATNEMVFSRAHEDFALAAAGFRINVDNEAELPPEIRDIFENLGEALKQRGREP